MTPSMQTLVSFAQWQVGLGVGTGVGAAVGARHTPVVVVLVAVTQVNPLQQVVRALLPIEQAVPLSTQPNVGAGEGNTEACNPRKCLLGAAAAHPASRVVRRAVVHICAHKNGSAHTGLSALRLKDAPLAFLCDSPTKRRRERSNSKTHLTCLKCVCVCVCVLCVLSPGFRRNWIFEFSG